MDAKASTTSTAKAKGLTLKNVVAKNFLSSATAAKTLSGEGVVGAPGKIVIASTMVTTSVAPVATTSSNTIKPSPLLATNIQASSAATGTSSFNNPNIRQEKVKQNWDIIISALRSKATMDSDDPFLEMNGNFQSRHNYLHATDKENWIFFSIIISIVISLSILFCFLVFKFFPKYSD
jgi:hypothetical protein